MDVDAVELSDDEQPLVADDSVPAVDAFSGFSAVGSDVASRYSGDLGNSNSNSSIDSFAQPPGPNVESEPVPQSVYGRALFEASQLIHQSSQLSLPWETVVFAQIFGNAFPSIADPTDVLIHPIVPQSFTEFPTSLEGPAELGVASSRRMSSGPFFAHVMTSRRDVDAKQEELDLWDKAISKWQFIVVVCKFSGVIGARLKLYAESTDAQDAPRTILHDVLGVKSPRAAINRANALHKFFSSLTVKCNCLLLRRVLLPHFLKL